MDHTKLFVRKSEYLMLTWCKPLVSAYKQRHSGGVGAASKGPQLNIAPEGGRALMFSYVNNCSALTFIPKLTNGVEVCVGKSVSSWMRCSPLKWRHTFV